MAVKLDVANSIIAAYSRGKQEAVQAEEIKNKKEQDTLEAEQRQQQIDNQKKQVEEQIKLQKEQHATQKEFDQAKLNLDLLESRQKSIEFAEKTGGHPDYKPIKTEQFEFSPGDIGSKVTAKNEKTGEEISYRTQDTINRQAIAQAKAQRAPVIDEQKGLEKYKLELDKEMEKLSSEDKLNAEKVLHAQDAAARKTQSEIDFEHDLKLQQEKSRVDLLISGNKAGQEIWLDDPVDPDTATVYSVPKGTTWKEVLGNVKLDTAGRKKLEASVNFEPLVLEAKDYLSQTTDNGKRGYDRYFLGAGAGLLGDLQQKIPGLQDQYVTSIAPTLGNFFLKAKELANLGSAFTPIEKKFLAEYTPGAERSLTPQAAEAMINKLIPAIRMERLNTIKTHGTKVGGRGDTTIKLSKEDTINPNKNDLGDGFKLMDETK